MQYAQVLATIAQSAAYSARLVYRKSRRDTRRTYRFLTSPQAVQTYRSLWQLLQIACMVAVALGMSARALVDQFIAAQQIPAEKLPLEPETESEILALPAPKPLRAEHSIVPFHRRPSAPTDAELVKWAKQNRASLPGLKVGKWSYSRKLRQTERQAVLTAMQTAQQSA